jgi:hypothetical protein
MPPIDALKLTNDRVQFAGHQFQKTVIRLRAFFIAFEINENRAAGADAVALNEYLSRETETIDEHSRNRAREQHRIRTCPSNTAVLPQNGLIIEMHAARRRTAYEETGFTIRKVESLSDPRSPRF